MEQGRNTDAETLPQEVGRSVITTRRHVRTITTAGHITTGHVADDEEDYDDTNHQVTVKWHSHEFSISSLSSASVKKKISFLSYYVFVVNIIYHKKMHRHQEKLKRIQEVFLIAYIFVVLLATGP